MQSEKLRLLRNQRSLFVARMKKEITEATKEIKKDFIKKYYEEKINKIDKQLERCGFTQ